MATTLGMSLPALVFPVLVSRASRLPQFDRGLKALKLGLGPVALGSDGGYLLPAGQRRRPGGWKGLVMIAICAAAAVADPAAAAGIDHRRRHCRRLRSLVRARLGGCGCLKGR